MPRKLRIEDAAAALREAGYTLGKGETDLVAKVTRYQVTRPDGVAVTMTVAEIKKLINALDA